MAALRKEKHKKANLTVYWIAVTCLGSEDLVSDQRIFHSYFCFAEEWILRGDLLRAIWEASQLATIIAFTGMKKWICLSVLKLNDRAKLKAELQQAVCDCKL